MKTATGAIGNTRLAAMAAMAISVVYLLAVHTYAGQLADTRAMLDLAEVLGGAPWPDAVLLAITPATALLAACSLALFAGMVHGVRAAAVVLFTSAGTAVGAVVLKALLVRPQLLDDAANSLPSGHVAVVAGLAAAAAAVAAPCHRILVIGLGLLGVSLTGVATIALRWHRPSDVVASALLAVGVAAASRAAVGRAASSVRPR